MTKVIVRCLLLDWNHWMSVHAMNFYLYLWLLKILWPGNTSSHISRHLEFIIEQGHRVNWFSGSLDSRVTGSLGHKMWPSSISGGDADARVTGSTCGRSVWVGSVQFTYKHLFTHLQCSYSAPGKGAEYCDENVSVCVCVREHISGTTL